MRILILCQYYPPEEFGSGVWVAELARGMVALGHDVTVGTAFPHYPARIVFDGYKGKFFQKEKLDKVDVWRSYIYANPSDSSKSRLLNWGSFCASTFFGCLFRRKKHDVIYAILPPLPLGVVGAWLSFWKRTPLITNIQDIYPDAAIDMGFLRNPKLIHFFKRMENYVYRKSSRVVVISDGFKRNLMAKGVVAEKVDVVWNWADTDFIQPGDPDPEFRKKLGIQPGEFAVIYSGSLSNNSCIERLIEAAARMQDEPVRFVIIGGGVREQDLKQDVAEKGLTNVNFHPFQPLALYPDVLRASDMSVVALNKQAAQVSVPSKVYKQMAAGRPILAITSSENELTSLVHDANCGVVVSTESHDDVCNAIRKLMKEPNLGKEMGMNARDFVVKNCSRSGCFLQIEAAMKSAAKNQ